MWDVCESNCSAGLLIDESDREDLAFWALVFDVSAVELEHAIALVGPTETAVRGYLGQFRPPLRMH